jgi:hypothetical protein
MVSVSMTLLRALYAIAIFLASCLLFLLEPMAGKWLVPRLGGSAAVWTTCLVFFQTALLLGYLCAHWLNTRLRPRAQTLAYSVLLLAGLAQGSASLSPDLHASTAHPILSVFWLLTALIGFPFLVLSATNPLLQAWYARGCARPAAGGGLATPFRLFALSNFGSLLALVIYPWLIEPRFSLHEQAVAWLAGFLLLSLASAGIMLLGGNRHAALRDASADALALAVPRPSAATRALWLLLAACGSWLLCAVTGFLTQNVAAIPLLWIIPLIAYLLSFVVAFQGERYYPRRLVLVLLVPVLGAIGYLLHDEMIQVPKALQPWLKSFYAPQVAVPFFCCALFLACLFCHGELHRRRPAPQHATSFYLSIAAGGALGAVLVGVMAPLIFSSNPDLACGVAFTALLALATTWKQGPAWRRLWLAVSVALVAVVFLQARNYGRDTIFRARSFYGTLRVAEITGDGDQGPGRALYNGVISHGTQFYSQGLRTTPTTYYSRDSGVGLALDLCCGTRPRRVGVIGLGTGTLAAYGRPGDVFRFYEIDPVVEGIAHNLFSYLRDSAARVEVVPGDARVSLAGEPPQGYDVLAVDAFSSDAIPVHLLTRQAFELYQRQLRPGGILAIHISSLYLDLGPVVEEQAEHAGLQAVLVVADDNDDTAAYGSSWVLVTADRDFLARPEILKAGTRLDPPRHLRLWTDDYNSLLPLLKKPEPENE